MHIAAGAAVALLAVVGIYYIYYAFANKNEHAKKD